MVNLRLLISCLLALAFLPAMAEEGTKVTVGEFTCTLPPGWHQINNPKALFAAVPDDNNGRFFGITVEPATACPIPCDIDDESDYEQAFWAKFDRNFESHGNCRITNRGFRLMNGLPFRVIDAVKGYSEDQVYVEVVATPANGKCYGLLMMKRGALPQADADLQSLTQSFSFLQPPRLAWYQPLLHQSSNILGAPLLLVVLGMGIYLLTNLGNSDVSARKINVGSGAAVLSIFNGYWIAGLNSVIGIVSICLFGVFILLLQPVFKERRALIAAGKMAGATPSQIKSRLWILAGAFLLGAAISDVPLVYSGESLPVILGVNVLTVGVFALVLWRQRRKIFPKPNPIIEPNR